jgi:chromosome segregation ATPase
MLQIVIGGRNKYLINGHVAQPSRVQTMFHSVQLNVNNPHFLIMQGRITKVWRHRGHSTVHVQAMGIALTPAFNVQQAG